MKKLSNEELGRLSVDEFKKLKKTPFAIVLDNVRSGYNVGSVFRTCDAFSIECIFLCGITAKPPDKEISKTALGATDSVEWKYYANTLEAVKELKNQGYEVWAVEQAESSVSLNSFKIEKKKYAFVFGHEVKGVDQDVINECSGCIEIPQLGMKHSLNIATAAGVVLWEIVRTRMKNIS